jgi:hypothetical protein
MRKIVDAELRFPRGLKPGWFYDSYGGTEVPPFQNVPHLPTTTEEATAMAASSVTHNTQLFYATTASVTGTLTGVSQS